MHATPASARAPDAPLAAADLLLVGINYRPEETGIAPYTAGLAEHLAARGARVTAITGVPHYPHWRVTEGYRGRLQRRELVRGVVVRRFRHAVPARQTAVQRVLYEGTFLLNALRAWDVPRPRVVVGVVPSLGGGVLAALAAARFRVPFGLIFQDLIGQAAVQSGMPGGGRLAGATRAIEGQLARRAAAVAVVAESFPPYLQRLGVAPERIVHLPNWSHIAAPTQPRAAVRAALGWPAAAQVVLHAGNMGYKQALEHVLVAARLAAATRPDLRFVLIGDGNQRAALETLAAGAANVAFLPLQPAERFPDVLHAADVLLVSERSSVVDMSLPSKLTSYFVAGRPIVAAVAADGGTACEVARSGAGLVTAPEDAGALLAALDRLATDGSLRDRLAAAGPRFAARHLDAEAALARAERFVATLIEGSTGRTHTFALRGAV